MLTVGFGHHAIHVDNDGLALLCRRCGATGSLNVVVGVFAILELYGIGVEHLTVDANGVGIAGYYDAVAIS